MNDDHEIDAVDRSVISLWAAVVVLLLGLSWKLWIPGFTDFPRIPVLNVLSSEVFLWLHYLAALVLVCGLAMIVLNFGSLRWGAGAVALSLAVLFCCNQHCLQPWAWQAFIIATVLFCMPIRKAKKWIGWLLISIYLYSAIGKFDYQFIYTTGDEFLATITGWLGLAVAESWRPWLVLLFPVGELAIALGLMIRDTRRLAACLAIVLHVSLIAVLSPLGLGHRWPVIVWNGLSVFLVVWLFFPESRKNTDLRESYSPLGYVGVAVALVVLFGPLLRPMQLWDHWLAWGLYSPSNSRVEVVVFDSGAELVEEPLQKYFVATNRSLGVGSRFAMEKWSLDELGVPIYPQARFQKAAAVKWLDLQGIAPASRVFELGPSNPWTGKRVEITVDPRQRDDIEFSN